jgi:16S rRNA C1402 (ribose-2'-O) methylase RsmI
MKAKPKFIIGCNHLGNQTDIPLKVLDYLNSGSFVWIEHEDELAKDLERLCMKKLTNYKIFTNYTLEDQIAETKRILDSGENVMLLTHMGYPGTADPGSDLIKHVRSMGFEIQIIAGPSVAPLSVALSGLVGSEKGYLVRETFASDGLEISKYLKQIDGINELLVFIDFNHKMIDILSLMLEVFKEDREASLIINGGLENQLVINGKYTEILKQIKSYPTVEIKKVVRLGYERETIEIPEIFLASITTIVSKGKQVTLD